MFSSVLTNTDIRMPSVTTLIQSYLLSLICNQAAYQITLCHPEIFWMLIKSMRWNTTPYQSRKWERERESIIFTIVLPTLYSERWKKRRKSFSEMIILREKCGLRRNKLAKISHLQILCVCNFTLCQFPPIILKALLVWSRGRGKKSMTPYINLNYTNGLFLFLILGNFTFCPCTRKLSGNYFNSGFSLTLKCIYWWGGGKKPRWFYQRSHQRLAPAQSWFVMKVLGPGSGDSSVTGRAGGDCKCTCSGVAMKDVTVPSMQPCQSQPLGLLHFRA